MTAIVAAHVIERTLLLASTRELGLAKDEGRTHDFRPFQRRVSGLLAPLLRSRRAQALDRVISIIDQYFPTPRALDAGWDLQAHAATKVSLAEIALADIECASGTAA